MTAPMKHAELVDEVKALGGLIKDVTQREVETRREVAAINGRLATVESDMKILDDTVTGMAPLLKRNNEMTFTTAQDVTQTKRDVAEIKSVVDQIGPDIGDLKKMIAAQQDRDAFGRLWVTVRKRGISISAFVVAIGALFTATASGFWWVWTHFKAMP